MTARWIATALVIASAGGAHASSDAAWTDFQTEVSKACIAAAEGLIANGRALVDPHGSEHFGLAVVTGPAKGTETTTKTLVSAICVFDKQTRKAEIGGEIPADRLKVKPDDHKD